MKVLALIRYGRLGSSSRMRFLQFMPCYERMGIECFLASFFDDKQLAKRYKKNRHSFFSVLRSYGMRMSAVLRRHDFDLVWIEKEALPWFPVWMERWLLRGVPYVLDIDDAVFHNYDSHSSSAVRMLFGRRIDSLMGGSRLVVSGNAYLAQRAKEAGAPWVEIVPTVIDLDRYSIKPASTGHVSPMRIIWIGSSSTSRYLELLRRPLALLRRRFEFRLRIIGGDAFTLPGVDIESMPWSEETEAELIQECDIGVMPLFDSQWERGKCGYKLIQYMACGLPVVASPVGVNCEIVRNGENGYLADTDQAWVAALGVLLNDAMLRQKMGAAGRKRVEEEYCIQQVAPRMVELLRAAAGELI